MKMTGTPTLEGCPVTFGTAKTDVPNKKKRPTRHKIGDFGDVPQASLFD